MPYQPNREELKHAIKNAVSDLNLGGRIVSYLAKEYPEFICDASVDTLIVLATVGRVEVKVVL